MSKSVIECPVNYFEKNLIFNTGRNCWAAYKLGGFNYDYQSRKTKDSLLASLVHTIKNVAHMKILIVPTTEDVELHYNKVKKNMRTNDALYEKAVNFDKQTCDYLKRTGENWIDYTTYLIVKLQDEAVDELELFGKQVREFFKSPAYNIMSVLLLRPEDITTVAFRKYEKIEDEAFQALSGCIETHRLSSGETQWLIKRVGFKGLKTPIKLNKVLKTITDAETETIKKEYSEDWTPYCEYVKKGRVEYYRPHKADAANLFSGILKCEGTKGISIKHDSGEVSYQSYLAVTNIPEAITFPGKEWIYRLQKQPVPVEICIDIENMHYKKALDTLKNKQTEINAQVKNIADVDAPIPSKLQEARSQIETLSRELGDNRLPMCKTTISICIAGSNKEQIEKDIKYIKSHLDQNEFVVERPGADQMRLFMQHIPGTESYTTDFVKKLSPFPVAGGMFGVNNRAGDNVGYYIGMANGKPVFLSFTQASLENKSPAATFYGDLGFGKSFNVNVQAYLHVLHGGRCIVIDPKGERPHWKSLPLIGEHVNIVELTGNEKNRGLLDPFIMFPNDIEHAGELAISCLMKLLNIKSGDDESVLLKESVRKVKLSPNPCMLNVVNTIGAIDAKDPYYINAVRLFRNLKSTMDNGLSQLLFGNGTEQAITVNSKMNIISFKGLSFPEKDTPEENYNEDQKMASVLMYLVVDFTKQFAWLFPNIPKMVLIDESWMITSIALGGELIKALARLGRSLFLAVLLNGHSVLDLPGDELRATITYKFCFHTNDEKEAERMLEYLKLEKTAENIQTFIAPENKGGLVNGECLFSDLYGRVSRLKFDVVFNNLIPFFKTTPEPEKGEENQGTANSEQGVILPDENLANEENTDFIGEDYAEEIAILLAKTDALLKSTGKTA